MSAKTKDGLGAVRKLLRNWTTPLLPDDYSSMINPLWSTRELRGVIRGIQRYPEANTVIIDIEPGWGVPVAFQAGQYIGLGVRINGRYVWRSYSLINAPSHKKVAGNDKQLFSICVRAIEDGKLSQHLQDVVREGQHIRLAAPAGDFHLTNPVPEKLLFITAGSGITPVISMLRTLKERHALNDAILIHSVRHEDELLFSDTLDELRDRFPHFQTHIRVTSENGRITTNDIEELAPDFASRAPYACGPATMLEDLERWWNKGEEKEYPLRTEQFTLARSSDARGGTIHFGDRKTVEADGATTILEAAEDAGVQLPFGCRMGICQTCVQTVKDGHALDLRTGETHEPGSRVRVCCSVANGDITLDV